MCYFLLSIQLSEWVDRWYLVRMRSQFTKTQSGQYLLHKYIKRLDTAAVCGDELIWAKGVEEDRHNSETYPWAMKSHYSVMIIHCPPNILPVIIAGHCRCGSMSNINIKYINNKGLVTHFVLGYELLTAFRMQNVTSVLPGIWSPKYCLYEFNLLFYCIWCCKS